MSRHHLFAALLVLLSPLVNAQWYFTQYFDGADTSAASAVLFDLDNDTSNVWQVGPPTKNVFNAAYTAPNALVTDTALAYGPGQVAHAGFKVSSDLVWWGILAVQWMQKLDYEAGTTGGLVEFSGDGGLTWDNAFTSPYVYSFYGYMPGNEGTLPDGTACFTGTDTTWRNVWFCLDLSWMWATGMDTLQMRFTHVTGSNSAPQDGWMIDNLVVAFTLVHTVTDHGQPEYIMVHPTPTQGPVQIEVARRDGYHVIESIEMLDTAGRVVKRHGPAPTKFAVDLSGHPPGQYYLRVRTNLDQRTVPVLLTR